MTEELQCEKCGSTQLSADKKGFSGKQAVAGAVLTGGIGVLAGTIGSNKIKITCLSCGHQFEPGHGIIIDTDSTVDIFEQKILQIYKGSKLKAVAFYKNEKGVDFATAKNEVEAIAKKNNIETNSPKGCMVTLSLLFIVLLFFYSCENL